MHLIDLSLEYREQLEHGRSLLIRSMSFNLEAILSFAPDSIESTVNGGRIKMYSYEK